MGQGGGARRSRAEHAVEVGVAEPALGVETVAQRDELLEPRVAGAQRRGVDRWAGPWPVIERGWDAARARRAHRFQIVDTEQVAWLLVCEEGGWTVEGRYD